MATVGDQTTAQAAVSAQENEVTEDEHIQNTQPAPTPGHWLLIAHVPGRTPVAFDSYARDFGLAFQPHLASYARTHGDVDQFRDDHCGQLCCAAALIFRDYGLDVLRAAA